MAPETTPGRATLRVAGSIPPEAWNRFGRSILPKLQAGEGLRAEIELQVSVDGTLAGSIEADVRRAVDDMMLSDQMQVEREESADSE